MNSGSTTTCIRTTRMEYAWRRPLSISDSYSMWSRDSRRAGIANGRVQEDVPRAYHGQEAMLRATYPPGCRGRVPSIIGGTCRRVPFSFDLICAHLHGDFSGLEFNTQNSLQGRTMCAHTNTRTRAFQRLSTKWMVHGQHVCFIAIVSECLESHSREGPGCDRRSASSRRFRRLRVQQV